MRVVTFAEFVALPDGVVYSEYEPCVIEGLYRRGRVLPVEDPPGQSQITDFYCMDLLAKPDHESLKKDDPDTAVKFDEDYWIRWACYDYNQLFVVYEAADVQNLVANLTRDVTGVP